ncbi:enoyl-CoA hydratase/isomerase family protein [Kallotenue papyrolyticum]|uniref:enoyl-CoA hydratase/isomerase family protein n=1 Tax=Kallotenue papyrolyticum TaxID=1325125 RepID=UPI000492683C|nr:enoyl-CoA hydratase-related protein [Kallotenue papyrolyticum]
MSYQYLLVEQDGPVAIITLNRPQQLNALCQALLRELEAALDAIAADENVRAVIITGAGERAFAAGADISELAQLPSATAGRELALRSHRLARKMADLPKPIIAAINGYALGGGLELALACDIRLAADTAQLGLPEVTLGIMPGWGGTQRLLRLTGPGVAKLLMMTGERISAQQAQQLAIVERVVPQAELLDAAKHLAHTLAGMPPLSIAAIKEAVNRGHDMALDDANAFEAGLFGALTATEDAKEGTRAFLEKRKPTWRGR